MSRLSTRLSMGRIIAALTLFSALVGAAPAAAAHTTPDAAEHWYDSCMQGAPVSPDGYERWAGRCKERVAAGRM